MQIDSTELYAGYASGIQKHAEGFWSGAVGGMSTAGFGLNGFRNLPTQAKTYVSDKINDPEIRANPSKILGPTINKGLSFSGDVVRDVYKKYYKPHVLAESRAAGDEFVVGAKDRAVKELGNMKDKAFGWLKDNAGGLVAGGGALLGGGYLLKQLFSGDDNEDSGMGGQNFQQRASHNPQFNVNSPNRKGFAFDKPPLTG